MLRYALSLFVTAIAFVFSIPVHAAVPATTTTVDKPTSLQQLAREHIGDSDSSTVKDFAYKIRSWNRLDSDTVPAGQLIVLPRFEGKGNKDRNISDFPGSSMRRQEDQTASNDDEASASDFDFPGSSTEQGDSTDQDSQDGQQTGGFDFGGIDGGAAKDEGEQGNEQEVVYSNWAYLYREGDFSFDALNKLFLNKRARERVDELRFGEERRFVTRNTLGFESSVGGFALDMHLESSNQTEEYAQDGFLGRNTTLNRNYLHLNELSYSSGLPYDSGRLLLGKKPLYRGVGNLFSPADHHNRLDATDPLNIREQGIWRASYTLQLPRQSFGAHVMPYFEPNALPSVASRWNTFGAPDQSAVFDTDTLQTIERITVDVPETQSKEWNVMMTWDGTFYGIDLFLDAAHGPIHRPLATLVGEDEGDTAAQLFYIDYDRASGGFSTNIYNYTLYGELLYRRPSEEPVDDTINKGMVGVMRTVDADPIGFKRAIVNLEYAREDIVNRADPEIAPLVTTRDYRVGRNAAFGAVRLQGENFDWENGFRLNFKGETSTYLSRLKYQLDHHEVSIRAEILNDDDSSSVTGERWGNNDRVSFRWTTSF